MKKKVMPGKNGDGEERNLDGGKERKMKIEKKGNGKGGNIEGKARVSWSLTKPDSRRNRRQLFRPNAFYITCPPVP